MQIEPCDGKETEGMTKEHQDELMENVGEVKLNTGDEGGGTNSEAIVVNHIPDTDTKLLTNKKSAGKHDLTWQELEEKEEDEMTVKLLNSSPVEIRSKRNRPLTWKVRENLDNRGKLESKKKVNKKVRMEVINTKTDGLREVKVKEVKVRDKSEGMTEDEKERDSLKADKQSNSDGCSQKNGDDERKENMIDDVVDMQEKILKKDIIIDSQLTEIENLKKELREARIKERKQDDDARKMISTIMEKEDLLKKINGKMAELSNSQLKELKCKSAKKVDREVQTDEVENRIVDSLTILDKLPCMNRKMVQKTNKEITGKNILNINTARGQKDKCFNCFDLEHKIDEITKSNKQLKKQVVDYQEKLGKNSSYEEEKPKKTREMSIEERRSDTGSSNDIISECPRPASSGDSHFEPKQSGKQDEGVGKSEENEIEMGNTVVYNGGGDDQEKEEDIANCGDLEGYFRERNNMEEFFIRRELLRREATHAKAGVGEIDDPSTDEQIRDIREDSEQRRKKLVSDGLKDKTPLCNIFVSTGKCWKKGCRYTHKRLCRGLEIEGECTKLDCRDGHNIDGICRHFNNNGCWNSRERCRYLHIRIKAVEEQRRIGGREEESKMSGSESTGDAEEEKCDEFILFNGEWYCNDSAEDEEEKEDRTWSPHGENQREKIIVNNDPSGDEKEKENGAQNGQESDENGQKNENEGQQGNSNEVQKIIERDLGHFLQVDRRHDIWNQIKATKAEIKELVRSMQGMKEKRREDRNL